MRDEIEQLRVQLAGCGVAALGGTSGAAVAREGDYGWSPAYQNVLDLRRQYDGFASGIDRALCELGEPQPGYPVPVSNAVEILRMLVGR